MRLAVVASHPIQYHAPLFRTLARQIDLEVFFAHRATPKDQAQAGFGVGFDWDVDLLEGYDHVFLHNAAAKPGLHSFAGCDTPEIGRRLSEGRFDTVLVMGWHLKSFWQAIFAAKRLHLPSMARGDSNLQKPRGVVKRTAKSLTYPGFLRLFDAALYVGERSRAYWRRYLYPDARLFFSPNCVDAEWFAERATLEARTALRTKLGLAPDSKAVLFAGKLVPFKRPLDVIAAASQFKSRGTDIHVLVAGSGPMQTEIDATARTSGVPCHMLGFRNQSEMPAVYAAADCLALPSSGQETWGLVANEALACGKPIIVSDAAGCSSDLAADRSTGRVFALGDVKALAAALSDLMDHPPSAAAIAAKSAAYSLGVAADGIVSAASFAIGYHRSVNA
jgi:glycosyltransferase involved in cell wall biosynthesis